MRSLFQNLKSKSNPGLRLRIFDSSITPNRFVRMSGEELKSKERREEDRQIQKENMDKAMVAQVEKSISSSLTCGKCGQKKVSYSQAQTRSADEPMTVSTWTVERGEGRGTKANSVDRRFASVRFVGIGGSSVEGVAWWASNGHIGEIDEILGLATLASGGVLRVARRVGACLGGMRYTASGS